MNSLLKKTSQNVGMLGESSPCIICTNFFGCCSVGVVNYFVLSLLLDPNTNTTVQQSYYYNRCYKTPWPWCMVYIISMYISSCIIIIWSQTGGIFYDKFKGNENNYKFINKDGISMRYCNQIGDAIFVCYVRWHAVHTRQTRISITKPLRPLNAFSVFAYIDSR